MPAVSTLILRSMRMTGEKARGATLTTDEQTETLAELNTMMESWRLERLMCYSVTERTQALTASTESYTVTSRPMKIIDPCFVRDGSGYDTPVRIIDAASYGRIVDKDAGFTVPTHLYYDAAYSATSTATLTVYPSPSASLTLHFNTWEILQRFANLSTTVLLPDGYQLAIESNFAIHLAAGLVPVSNELAKIARESKAAIKGVNVPETIARIDAGVVTGYSGYSRNIFTG